MKADDTSPNDLPPAFGAEAPGDDQGPDKFGAGHLIETSVPEETREARRRASEDASSSGDGSTEVDEASEESFPGSDPPSHGRTTS